MLFNQLKTGDSVYIIEVIGTFKKTNVMESLESLLFLKINQ